MKKLLILLLVMGVASTANATLTLVSSEGNSLDPDGVAFPSSTLIGIYNDTAAAGQGAITYVVFADGEPASWTGVTNIHEPPVPAAGGASNYYGVMDLGAGDVDIWQSDLALATVDPWGVGVLADFELECTGMGAVTVMLLDENLAVSDSLVIEQIPEPFTFGLLGLGGLFLRRRK